MRSRVVAMREMKEKFGAEVQSFRYSFVLPNHGSEWDGSNSLDPEAARAVLAKARAASPAAQATQTAQRPQPLDTRIEGLPAPRRRATDKQPTFIEVKPRS
jgi:hypothetical protein